MSKEADETAAALKKAKGLVLTKLQADMDSLDVRYTELTTERDRLSAELQTASRLDDAVLTRALQFRTDMMAGLVKPTFEYKWLYLELLQVNVQVKIGKVIIGYRLSVEPLETDLSRDRLTAVLSMV